VTRLTTLGTGTIALSAERACAGYFVERGDVRLLIDCGAGITRRLAEHAVPWQDITHVALTHFHIDHHGDLPTLIFAWKYGMLPARTSAVEVLGPAGTTALLDRLAACYGAWVTNPGFAVTVREMAPGARLSLGPGLDLSCHKVPHTEESVAYSIETGTRRIVYTGDTGPSEELGAWAAGCDLLVAECSLPDAMAIPEHLTPAQCGDLAARAGAGHLVLSHFYPPVERIGIETEVRRAFGGALTLAHDGWTIDIEDE
jgi:ribonuclease BN (tRNA processing enzyme)